MMYSTSIVDFPNATYGSASPDSLDVRYLPLLNPFRRFDWLASGESLLEEMLDQIQTVFPVNRYKRNVMDADAEEEEDTATVSHLMRSKSVHHWAHLKSSNQTANKFNKTKDEAHKHSKQKGPFQTIERLRKAGKGVPGSGSSYDTGRYWRDMDSLHYTESEPYGIKASHPKTHWIDDQRHHDRHVVVDPKKTTCMLYLQADHLFFEKMGSQEACIESMTRHVQKVNSIYKNTGKCCLDDCPL